MVTVRLYANLRDIAGKNELRIDGSTAKEIIDRLNSTLGEKFDKIMKDENGKLRENIIFLVNGKNIRFLSGTDTKIEGGDIIDIFPPVAGG